MLETIKATDKLDRVIDGIISEMVGSTPAVINGKVDFDFYITSKIRDIEPNEFLSNEELSSLERDSLELEYLLAGPTTDNNGYVEAVCFTATYRDQNDENINVPVYWHKFSDTQRKELYYIIAQLMINMSDDIVITQHKFD